MTPDQTPDQTPDPYPAELPDQGADQGSDQAPGPFDAFGGGFDMGALLEQAQQMQERLENAQAQLAEATVEGTVGGGAVTVTINGVGELVGVRIKEGGFDSASADDLDDLGDLIVAAYRDAKGRADALASRTLGPLAGGLPGLG